MLTGHLAASPAVAAGDAWPMGVQAIVLSLLHVLDDAVIYSAVSYRAGAVFTERPRAARAVGLLSGPAMIGLGPALAGEKL